MPVPKQLEEAGMISSPGSNPFDYPPSASPKDKYQLQEAMRTNIDETSGETEGD